ncbi:MAG: ADP-ribosylglycohydrolase family protein, partial [Proteobacteria bacterium]|nr:ADP-ribosylglycohydrolase family protein [Pseudomonadota bacterium]
ARTGKPVPEIREYIESKFGYNLSRTCDEIRPEYCLCGIDETCQGTVPEALIAAFEGKDFEDVIRLAVSLGGDSDTLACIAGSVAEALHGIPKAIAEEALRRLPEDMRDVLREFGSNWLLEMNRNR